MLSHNLKSLCDRLRHYRDTGASFAPEAIFAVVAILDVAIKDARHLENCAISPQARVSGDLPDNVIRIAEILNRKGVTVGVKENNKGGDAA